MKDGFEPPDVHKLAEQLMADATPEQKRTLVDALMGGRVTSIFEKLNERPEPTVAPVSDKVRGFRVRLDLQGAKPPVWRRLELPGDMTLPRVHDVIQAAMGWTDSHLHRFTTSSDPRASYFLTQFDLDEGDEGILEDDVRLDQVVAAKDDRLFYEYDFGDGWHHVLKVEEVLDTPPPTARCLTGKLACPPEDCGGLGGYEELATWVRSGYDDAHLPDVFDSAEDGRDWLPLDWHPDHFDVEEVNAALAVATAEPVEVVAELAKVAEQMERRGILLLRRVLGRPMTHGPTDVTDADADRLTETLRILLDIVGDGVTLTSAGYLPPAVVEQLAERSGIASWWIGKANREDLTPPVAQMRELARSLGLVSVRKGRLAPTTAAKRCDSDPHALLRHIAGRLPLGTKDFDRHAGWMTLAVAAGGTPAGEWHSEVAELLHALGWSSGRDRFSPPPAGNPTLDVLELVAGAARARRGRIEGIDLALAAVAGSIIKPPAHV